MANIFAKFKRGRQASAVDGFAIVPHDSNDLSSPVRGIYVGGVGNVVIESPEGNTVTYNAVPAGTQLQCEAVKVLTASTATLMTGMV